METNKKSYDVQINEEDEMEYSLQSWEVGDDWELESGRDELL